MKRFSLLRVGLFFLTVFSLVFFTTTPLFAQTNYTTSINDNVPITLHTNTQAIVLETTSALACLMTGLDVIDPSKKCLGIDPTTRKLGYVDGAGGAIGGVSNLIAILYTPPMHTSDYFTHLGGNFGIVKHAYAQNTGIGFQGLLPLLPLWAAFRNVVYLIFVLMFLFIGVGVMLRVKIDPRTVMTLENQIPRIIIALLLITFSFPIAGFFIDMMYVSIYLIAGVLGTVPGADTGVALANIQGQNTFEFVNSGLGGIMPLANDPASAAGNMVASLFGGPILVGAFNLIAAGGTWFFGTQLAQALAPGGGAIPGIGAGIALTTIAIFTALTPFFASQMLSLFVHILVFFIIAAAILFALFRLWFSLLFAYINFLMDVVLAPFFIIGGLLPGSPINFEGWLRDMIANLAAFPVTITMFLLGKIFMQTLQNSSGLFVPPLIGNPANIQAISSLVGMAIILITPGIVGMVREALKAPTFKYTGIAAQQIASGVSPVERISKGAANELWGIHPPGNDHGGRPGRIARILGLTGGHH